MNNRLILCLLSRSIACLTSRIGFQTINEASSEMQTFSVAAGRAMQPMKVINLINPTFIVHSQPSALAGLYARQGRNLVPSISLLSICCSALSPKWTRAKIIWCSSVERRWHDVSCCCCSMDLRQRLAKMDGHFFIFSSPPVCMPWRPAAWVNQIICSWNARVSWLASREIDVGGMERKGGVLKLMRKELLLVAGPYCSVGWSRCVTWPAFVDIRLKLIYVFFLLFLVHFFIRNNRKCSWDQLKTQLMKN
jgi:hypothetical protein